MPETDLPVSYEDRGDYVFWDMSSWEGDFDVLGELEAKWKEINSEPHVDGSVVVLNDDLDLGPDFQEHISEKWSALTGEAEIDRIAFVADRIMAMAVKSNIAFSGVEVESTDSIEEATDWVQQ